MLMLVGLRHLNITSSLLANVNSSWWTQLWFFSFSVKKLEKNCLSFSMMWKPLFNGSLMNNENASWLVSNSVCKKGTAGLYPALLLSYKSHCHCSVSVYVSVRICWCCISCTWNKIIWKVESDSMHSRNQTKAEGVHNMTFSVLLIYFSVYIYSVPCFSKQSPACSYREGENSAETPADMLANRPSSLKTIQWWGFYSFQVQSVQSNFESNLKES